MELYYDYKTETMPREQVEALQLKLLNRQLKRAAKTQIYKNRIPLKINNLSDIKKLPFTAKEDLRKFFPYGCLAIKREKVARFNATSGTTGIPTLMCFSSKDIKVITERGKRHLTMAKLNKGEIVQSMLGTGLFVGGWYHNNAAFQLGMTVLPTGTGNTKRQIDLLKTLKADSIFITSSYLQYLLHQLSKEDLNETNLKTALTGAEPLSKAFREIALKKYGVEIYESYGMTETGGPFAHECCYHNGLHVAEDQFYFEIVDPKTLKMVPDGEYGELVLTPLQQEAVPLIRYRTGDITRIVKGDCPCGRTHRRIEPALSRIDDMVIVNGVNIYPSQIEECVYKHLPEATNYLVHIVEQNMLKKVVIDIELSDHLLNDVAFVEKLQNELIKTLKSYITVTPQLNFVPNGTLKEIEGKSKRIIFK